jgi:hypothetical protein
MLPAIGAVRAIPDFTIGAPSIDSAGAVLLAVTAR